MVQAPVSYQHSHTQLVEEFKNESHWPKHLLIQYRFHAEHEVDLDRGLLLLMPLGALVCMSCCMLLQPPYACIVRWGKAVMPPGALVCMLRGCRCHQVHASWFAGRLLLPINARGVRAGGCCRHLVNCLVGMGCSFHWVHVVCGVKGCW